MDLHPGCPYPMRRRLFFFFFSEPLNNGRRQKPSLDPLPNSYPTSGPPAALTPAHVGALRWCLGVPGFLNLWFWFFAGSVPQARQ